MQRKQTHLTYGLIIGIAMIVVNAILLVTKLNTNPVLGMLGFVVFLVGIIMNGMAYSKANDADITFGQAFSSCFKATAVVALITVAWSLISLMIFPNMMEDAIEKARADMLAKGQLPEEQIEVALGYTRKFFKPLMIAGALFGTLFAGAIFSLIGAAIAKKNPQPVYEA